MTREEQILKAARDYNSGITLSSPSNIIHFENGAKWADEHPKEVWHDAKDKPRAKEWILVQFEEDEYEAMSLSESGVNTWFNVWVDRYKAIRWAYISDLLPKQFGNK